MDDDTFIARVRDADAGTARREDAEQLVQAVLRLLGERLTADEAADLAAQLPQQLGPIVTDTKHSPEEKFSLDEFFERVGSETGTAERADVERRVRAVTGVLADAISRGEMADVISQLPDRFGDLFAPKEL